jgi:transposase-like protein
MKTSRGSPRHRRRRTDAQRRAQLLAAFDRSGLSAAAFARQQGLRYTTFCGWRHRQAKARPVPGFVQVELPTRPAPVELLIELGRSARLRINSSAQLELAAALVHHFNASPSC